MGRAEPGMEGVQVSRYLQRDELSKYVLQRFPLKIMR